jgi:response regulator RpfG family c-di-GMP phosphodiesterase
VSRPIPQGVRVVDRLLAEGRITRDQHESALLAAMRTGDRADDAIVDVGILPEAELLKFLATLYKTRFVASEKLAKASVDRAALDRVPRRVADKLGVCPILFDAASQSLSVVATDLDEDPGRQVALATGLRDVKVYAARPAAVRAAIRRCYDGDPHAFAHLVRGGGDAFETFERAGGPQALGGGAYGAGAAAMGPGGAYGGGSVGGGLGGGYGGGFGGDFGPPARGPAAASPGVPPPYVPPPYVPQTGPAHGAQGGLALGTFVAPPVAPAPPPPGAPLGTSGAGAVAARAQLAADPELQRLVRTATGATNAGVADAVIAGADWLETMNVLVSLLEVGRGELRGHSSQVARMTRRVLERVGLPERDVVAIVAAAYLHDVGKTGAYHLTALNVAEYEGHRLQAQKTAMAPVRLFEGARLPDGTVRALASLYERWDGGGFPDRASGKEIPLGARILAVVETYADLVYNARNPFRKQLPPKEALEALGRYKGKVFDPNIVDLFANVMAGDDLRRKLEGRSRALVVDVDPEETTILELRLSEHGFDTLIARTADDALSLLESQEIDVVVAEVDLQPFDGLELLARARQTPRSREVPFLFLTRRADRETVQRGFSLGATDFLVKPTSTDVVVAKVRQAAAARAQAAGQGAGQAAGQAGGARPPSRGVSGSLREMALPDVVQILAHGRKSGRLGVTSGGKGGEVFFVEGQIHHAAFGAQRGEDAFYALLSLVEGEFALDPDGKPAERTIQASAEALLLEGLRRLDEGKL